MDSNRQQKFTATRFPDRQSLYPRVITSVLRRPLLEAAGQGKHVLTLACAAPGSGKSMFLQQLRTALPTGQATLLLDLHREQPARNGLKILCDTLAARTPVPPHHAVLATDGDATLVSAITYQLLAVSAPLNILIDGLQAGRDERLIRLLLQLVLLRPAQVRWFLGITGSIDLALVGLLPAVDRQLITAQDLAFTAADVHTLCSAYPGTPVQVEDLLQSSGGWPLLLLHRLQQQSFSKLTHCLQDCVPELEQLAPLALLEQWDLPAASAVLGMTASATEARMRTLQQQGFVWQSRAGLYVWHEGLRQFLLQMLRSAGTRLPDIYLRATSRLQDSPMPQWVQQELRAGPPAWALLLAGRLCRRWLQLHEPLPILQLLQPLALADVTVNTNLALCYLWALIMEQRLEEASRLLGRLQIPQLTLQQDVALPFPALDNTVQVLTLLIHQFSDNTLGKSERVTQLAVHAELPGLLQPQLLNLYANIQYSCGLFGIAREAAQRAALLATQHDNDTQHQMARSMMMVCDFMRGQLDSAVRQTEMDAVELQQRIAQRAGNPDPALLNAVAINDCARAYLHYETGDIVAAEQVLAGAMTRLQASGIALPLVLARVTRAKIQIGSGQHREAEVMLAQLEELAELKRSTRLQALVCYEKMRLRFYAGQRADDLIAHYGLADRCVQVETLFLDEYQEEHLFWLKSKLIAFLMDADYAAASEHALKGMIKSLHLGCCRHRVTFCLFKALSEFRLNRHADACASYNRALLLCQQAGYRRVLVDDSFGLADLWTHMREQNEFDPALAPAFLEEVQTAMEWWLPATLHPAPVADNARPAGEPVRDYGLTEKEVEILTLLAQGLCNKKIGSRASIALTTVKWHLQNIFSKLDARNRTEAVLKAQELSLLGGIYSR